MSIDLTGTKLQNASIQYTYPDMNIKNMTKDTNNVSKFYFQTSVTNSTFTFIDSDSDSNSYISGTPAQGIISKGIHTGNEYELTVKHISPTGSDYFYVVFPLVSGVKWTIIEDINKKASSSPSNIDIYADEYVGVSNKGLNDIIQASYNGGSDIYKYTATVTGTDTKNIFVFKKPLKVNISNGPNETHGLWSTSNDMNLITPENNTQILEEIECDYSGDKIVEPSINNRVLNKRFSRIMIISFFMIVLAIWIAYFKNIFGINYFALIISFLMIVAAAVTFYFKDFRKNNKKWYSFLKLLNPLNASFNDPWSFFYIILLLPIFNILYRSIMLGFYQFIKPSDENIDISSFLFGYYNFNEDEESAKMRQYNRFALNGILIGWIIYVCIIFIK